MTAHPPSAQWARLCSHKALEDLAGLVNSEWGRSTEGSQHIAALVLGFWQMTGVAVGRPPSYLLIHTGSTAKSVRDRIWQDFRRFRTVGIASDRSSRKHARQGLRRTRLMIQHQLDTGVSPEHYATSSQFDPTTGYLDRLAPRAFLQRLRSVCDPDVGLLNPGVPCVSVWIGADSQAGVIAPYLRNGVLSVPVRASSQLPDDSKVMVSIMGGVGADAWHRHLAPLVLEEGVPLLAMKTATSNVEPYLLDPRMAELLNIGAMLNRQAEPCPPYQPPFDDITDRYARLIQRHLLHTHPGHIQNLLGTLRMVPKAAALIITSTKFHNKIPPKLQNALIDRTCRGITAGSIALLPEVWAYSQDPEAGKLRAILSFVDTKGRPTRRDIQRKTGILATLRDEHLAHLATIGLVTLDGRHVKAVRRDKWIDQIPERLEFPEIPAR